ncbi:MAG: tRNA glutamyl-Q(34) synthetase GluQRS [Hydrogenophaga sp.]|jgi:glutamyl-Q tRNA(Asp) synthetase|nr:tRNA glutamyl-Q(34) synthetase GluQRS [Hydrogenophaga sp.]
MRYRGRFAPSPTGPLHAGSLVAALASWLDARAHGGQWMVRIEDVDTPRCMPGADALILQQLATCGLTSDEPVVWQSRQGERYQGVLQTLVDADRAYPCGCSRKDIEAALQARGVSLQRHGTAVYPGTCRPDQGGLNGRPARAWRFACSPAAAVVRWTDRRQGEQSQDVAQAVGDFVLKRADGLWAYQLAVVVDDAAQRITHVVRGEDLADNTPRQILLQQVLGLPRPAYLHTPLIRDAAGEKLSKQTGAPPLELSDPAATLGRAAAALGLPATPGSVPERLLSWTGAWRARWAP